MKHDNNPSRTAANERLRAARAERQSQLNVIHDAKYAIAAIEDDVKKELIKQRRTECLKIDWSKVERALNF
jgi:hypothetical protein